MGYSITFPTALPGFIVALCLGFALRWRGWLSFALAGALNVIPAVWLFDQFLGGVGASSMLQTALPLYCLPVNWWAGLLVRRHVWGGAYWWRAIK